MSRAARWWVLGIGLAGVAVLLGSAFASMPSFGAAEHPYRDAAVAASVAHGTANVVSAVNFDQRGLDTLGEETILFGSVVAVVALLRPSGQEHLHRPPGGRGPMESTRVVGYLMLPLTLVVGADLVVHGHTTPGGGFQGGIVLSTGLHLMYVAGRFRSLERLRPMPLFEYTEAAGTAAFAVVGLVTLATSGSLLANALPHGTFGQLLSAGTVPLLNVAVGIAVGSGGVVLLAQFLQQLILVSEDDDRSAARSGAGRS